MNNNNLPITDILTMSVTDKIKFIGNAFSQNNTMMMGIGTVVDLNIKGFEKPEAFLGAFNTTAQHIIKQGYEKNKLTIRDYPGRSFAKPNFTLEPKPVEPQNDELEVLIPGEIIRERKDKVLCTEPYRMMVDHVYHDGRDCIAQAEIVAKSSPLGFHVPRSQTNISYLPENIFNEPKYVMNENTFSDNFKHATHSFLSDGDYSTIVSFWGEKASGLCRYDGYADNMVLIQTVDYACFDRYESSVKDNLGSNVFLVDFPCTLSSLVRDKSFFYSELTRQLEDQDFYLDYSSSCYICTFVPAAAPLGSRFPYSMCMHKGSSGLSESIVDTNLPLVREKSSDQATAELNVYFKLNYSAEMDRMSQFVVYNPRENVAATFSSHNVFADDIVDSPSFGSTKTTFSQSIPSFLGYSVAGDINSWIISFSVPGSDYNVENSPCLTSFWVERPSSSNLYIPSANYEKIELHHGRPVLGVSGKCFAPWNTDYYYYRDQGVKHRMIFLDYLDPSKTFAQRRLRMLRAGLAVVEISPSPRHRYSFVVTAGQREIAFTYSHERRKKPGFGRRGRVVDRGEYSASEISCLLKYTLSSIPVTGVGWNDELLKPVVDPEGIVYYSDLIDTTAFYDHLKKLNKGKTVRQISNELGIVNDSYPYLVWTKSNSTRVIDVEEADRVIKLLALDDEYSGYVRRLVDEPAYAKQIFVPEALIDMGTAEGFDAYNRMLKEYEDL